MLVTCRGYLAFATIIVFGTNVFISLLQGPRISCPISLAFFLARFENLKKKTRPSLPYNFLWTFLKIKHLISGARLFFSILNWARRKPGKMRKLVLWPCIAFKACNLCAFRFKFYFTVEEFKFVYYVFSLIGICKVKGEIGQDKLNDV